jgi:predicted metal-dependent hydrolase
MALNSLDVHRGIDLFNRTHFFDAHEVLEDVWRSVSLDQPLRRHLQGMVQLAVAFHHESRGNHVGARSVLERALRNLHGADPSFPDIDLERLRADLAPWRRYLADSANASNAHVHLRDPVRDDVRVERAPKPVALPKITMRR